jgi:uncharacterized coiled-coil protein SlyX
MEGRINMSREVIDLAKNVKKEADAINELNLSLRKTQQHSPKKHHGASSSVDRFAEGGKDTRQLMKHIKELEGKISKYEEIIEELNNKLEKKDRKVDYFQN